MFCKQVWRNAAKNRKGNGLFLGSLVIAIVAFYTLLSLGEQDVMQFLAAIESDAVGKLLTLLPIVYALSLFFLFFLVYFACKYQMDLRRREFGMYLMLGMKRSRLFFMLLGETLLTSLISLLFGIFLALFLTEGISLATANIVGLGILGHRFSFSFYAVRWTVCGFIVIQLLSVLLLGLKLTRREPAEFLGPDVSKKQEASSEAESLLFFLSGILFLLFAYYLGIFRMRYFEPLSVFALFGFGIFGTFFFYRGLGGILGRRIRRKSQGKLGLDVFTARQVQEQVLAEHKSLAVCSLLLLMALSCISYGISVGIGRGADTRSTDFSIFVEEEELARFLEKEDVRSLWEAAYPVYLSRTDAEVESEGLLENIRDEEGGAGIAQSWHCEYVIAVSSYNQMLRAMGKEELKLSDNEVALFSSMGTEGDFLKILDRALKKGSSVKLGGETYALLPALCYDNIIADRAITLYAALVVPDRLFAELAREKTPYCCNLQLSEEVTKELGLMQAIRQMEEKLDSAGFWYDSFLKGIGRNLFYAVAASYLTIYLGILFLLIANTAIGLKYLIQQRQTKHRYKTLSMLGADTEEMCRSVKQQIQSFFLLVLGVAAVSSVAAIAAMFTSIVTLSLTASMWALGALAALALVAFLLVEFIYISIVKKMAVREIRPLSLADGR